MPQQEIPVILAGCGYTGNRTGRLWKAAGHRVWCLVRTEASAARAAQAGLIPVRCDLDSQEPLPSLPVREAMICYFVPPPRRDQDTRLRRFLRGLEPQGLPRTFLYISTSGVYGDSNGQWVTEATPPHPETARARRRVDAERTLQAWAAGRDVRAVILRVPAIYGPDRIPVQKIRDKVPVLRWEDAPFSNRIHVDDLAQICVTAALAGDRNQVFNVSDGDPRRVTDYYFTVADLLGLDRPPAISMAEALRTMSPMRLSFLRESRRIDNRQLLDSLDISLQYPSLESGVTASLRAMNLIR